MNNDAQVAAWAKEQNRGVPPWASLSEEGRSWWRERYAVRHGLVAEGQGANGA